MKIKDQLKQIKNPIARVIFFILFCIAMILLTIPAIPYAIIKGVCNLDYYEDWFDFIKEHIPL